MKLRIILGGFLVLLALGVCAVEGGGFLFGKYKPAVTVTNVANEYVLNWSRLPYPAYYEVEVLSRSPSGDEAASPSERIAVYRTWSTSWTINQNFPYRTYWRVSAHGLLRKPLSLYSEPHNLAEIMGTSLEDYHSIKPHPVSEYPAHAPAPSRPLLTWTVVPGAVYYEIEFLTQPPENPNDILPSRHQFFLSREVFTTGYNIDMTKYAFNKAYWRVRALDYYGNPIGVFSNAAEMNVDHDKPQILKPLINCVFNADDMATPLYPAYSWVPIIGAASYEVELLSQPPETAAGTALSQYRVWSKLVDGGDLYDEEARIIPGTYYWRVRGLDEKQRPVSEWSDAGRYVVDLTKGRYAATFGDSITHGGGAISYSPVDWDYSYQTYLSFPVVNLGRSGDTSETMLERFERDVLPFKPRYLIIMGGTNSLRGGTPASSVISDLAALRNKCLANGIRPIFLTLPPINPTFIARAFQEATTPNWQVEFAAVNNFIRKQRYHIDLEPHFVDEEGLLPEHYAIDGLHLDIEGKKLMAQIINANWGRVTK